MLFRCPNCKRSGFVTPPKVRCSCGLMCDGDCFDANTDPSITSPATPPELPCVHRGDVIRKLDCGCEGNSTLYRCELRGECLLRPLPASTFRGATCDACDVRQDPKERAAIITVHFNPARRQRLRDTFTEWAAAIGHPFACWELAFGEPEIPGSIAIPGDRKNCIWQKERLINLAISQLPPEVEYVAWIDHDLIFDNPHWLDIGIDMIRRGVDCVQLFSEVHYLGRDGATERRNRGAVSALQSSGQVGDSAPGGAWLASRAWLDSIGGLYERNICGGGDATFLHATTKCRTSYLDRQAPRLRDDSLAYASRVSATVGYVPGAVRHLWHGAKRDRQYHSRDEILRRHDFDPVAYLQIGQTGLLELADAPAGLADEIARYFADRRDDG